MNKLLLSLIILSCTCYYERCVAIEKNVTDIAEHTKSKKTLLSKIKEWFNPKNCDKYQFGELTKSEAQKRLYLLEKMYNFRACSNVNDTLRMWTLIVQGVLPESSAKNIYMSLARHKNKDMSNVHDLFKSEMENCRCCLKQYIQQIEEL